MEAEINVSKGNEKCVNFMNSSWYFGTSFANFTSNFNFPNSLPVIFVKLFEKNYNY